MFSFNFDPVPWNKWFSEWRQWEYLWSTLSNWWFRGKVKTFVSINFKCLRLTAIGSPLGLDKICRPHKKLYVDLVEHYLNNLPTLNPCTFFGLVVYKFLFMLSMKYLFAEFQLGYLVSCFKGWKFMQIIKLWALQILISIQGIII